MNETVHKRFPPPFVHENKGKRYSDWKGMNTPNFLGELKRRHVYRVAIAYAVVAWLLIQIATQVFPFFEIPNWVVRLVVLAVTLGFPVALIIAWAFELTPQGIKRAADVGSTESIAHWSTRKFAALIISVAILAAGVPLFQLIRTKPTWLPWLIPPQRPFKSRSQSCRCLTKAAIQATSIFRMDCQKN